MSRNLRAATGAIDTYGETLPGALETISVTSNSINNRPRTDPMAKLENILCIHRTNRLLLGI
jgi:hypothetical protein